MTETGPVIEISARFRDEAAAKAVAEALNRWFRWIVDGSMEPMPPFFDALGVASREYAWALEEDVDWTLGPHARCVGPELRIAIQTEDTHLRIAGLLRVLGGRKIQLSR